MKHGAASGIRAASRLCGLGFFHSICNKVKVFSAARFLTNNEYGNIKAHNYCDDGVHGIAPAVMQDDKHDRRGQVRHRQGREGLDGNRKGFRRHRDDHAVVHKRQRLHGQDGRHGDNLRLRRREIQRQDRGCGGRGDRKDERARGTAAEEAGRGGDSAAVVFRQDRDAARQHSGA